MEAVGPDTVRVRLAPGLELPVDDPRFVRRFAVTSACGVCGKSSREALEVFPTLPPPPATTPRVDPATVLALPERLRASQPVFGRTGGLHAAGLFDAGGQLLAAREDVGRHNAVDKIVGSLLLAGQLPAHDRLAGGQRPGQLRAGAEVRAGGPARCWPRWAPPRPPRWIWPPPTA